MVQDAKIHDLLPKFKHIELEKEMLFDKDKHIDMQTYVIIAVISCGIVATCVFMLLGCMAKPFDLRHTCKYLNTAAAIFVVLQITSFVCLSGGKVDRNRRLILTENDLNKYNVNYIEGEFAIKEPINMRVLDIFIILWGTVFALGIVLFVAIIIGCIKAFKMTINTRIDTWQLQLQLPAGPVSIFDLYIASIPIVFFVTILFGISTISDMIQQYEQTTYQETKGSVYYENPNNYDCIRIDNYKQCLKERRIEVMRLMTIAKNNYEIQSGLLEQRQQNDSQFNEGDVTSKLNQWKAIMQWAAVEYQWKYKAKKMPALKHLSNL